MFLCIFIRISMIVHSVTDAVVSCTSTTACGPATCVPVGASATAACCIADRIAVPCTSATTGMTGAQTTSSGTGQQAAQAKPYQHFLQIRIVHTVCLHRSSSKLLIVLILFQA